MRIVSVSCIILLSASSFCVMPVVCSSNKIIESYLYRINVFPTRKRMNRLIDLLIQINSYQVFINCLIDWIGINFNRRGMGKLKGDIPSKDVLLNASPISKWLSRKTFATNRRAQVSIINRPLNSISQPYDSKAKPRRNSSKKGNAEIGQRHVPASRETKPKVKNEKEKKGANKERRRRRRRREETGWSTASHSISRATTGISQTLSRRFPLTMVFPFCQPTNVRSLPSAPIDPASSNLQPLPFCSPKRICSFGRMEPRVRVGRSNFCFRAFSILEIKLEIDRDRSIKEIFRPLKFKFYVIVIINL